MSNSKVIIFIFFRSFSIRQLRITCTHCLLSRNTGLVSENYFDIHFGKHVIQFLNFSFRYCQEKNVSFRLRRNPNTLISRWGFETYSQTGHTSGFHTQSYYRPASSSVFRPQKTTRGLFSSNSKYSFLRPPKWLATFKQLFGQKFCNFWDILPKDAPFSKI